MRYRAYFIGLVFILLAGALYLVLFLRNPLRSANESVYFMSKKDGYYGLYRQSGRKTEKLFDSGDILQVYPNLARYHISFDVSADGRYVAYSAVNLLGDADIFLIDRKTGEVANLTRDIHTDTYPVFSHDSEWVAYLSHEKSGRRYDEITLIKRDGSRRIQLTNLFLRISSISFSPDDQTILFVKHLRNRSTITSLDIETGELSDLTGADCLNISPQFNSTGEQIVYVSDCYDSLDIWIMSSDGTNRKPLFRGGGDEASPHFMNDDQIVVFLSNSIGQEVEGRCDFSLYAVDLQGSAVRNLIPGKFLKGQFSVSHLDISDSRSTIYFQGRYLDRRRESHRAVYALDIEKNVLRKVVSGGYDSMNSIVRRNMEDRAEHFSL